MDHAPQTGKMKCGKAPQDEGPPPFEIISHGRVGPHLRRAAAKSIRTRMMLEVVKDLPGHMIEAAIFMLFLCQNMGKSMEDVNLSALWDAR